MLGQFRRSRKSQKYSFSLAARRGVFEPLENREMLHSSIVVTEVMKSPVQPTLAELDSLPGITASDFQFVEIYNTNPSESAALTGVKLAGDVAYSFPDQELGPNEFAVVVANPDAFQLRHGDMEVIGQWMGELSHDAAAIELIDGDGHPIIDFSIGGSELWPEQANGAGASLELITPLTTPAGQFSKHYRWQASLDSGGTPKSDNSVPIGVVINELFANGDSDEIDAIELKNNTSSQIDIGGWYISNSSEDFLKFRIPDETTIQPGSYVVFDESDFNPQPDEPETSHFTLDGKRGDSVWLTRNDGGANFDFIDHVHVPAQRLSESWGRIPDGFGRIAPLAARSLGESNQNPKLPQLMVSEFNYNPASPSAAALEVYGGLTASDLSFVEIYNPSETESLDLSDFKIGGDLSFVVADEFSIRPETTIVVTGFDPSDEDLQAKRQAFRVHYEIGEDVALVDGFLGVFGAGGGFFRLVEIGDALVEDPGFTPEYLVDEVVYDSLFPWPESAAGQGDSLSRASVSSFGNFSTSWHAAIPSPGQTDLVPPPIPLLPDLAIWDDAILGFNYLDYLDTHPDTGRQLMRFSTAAANRGAGPIIVEGGLQVEGKQEVYQVIQNDDGSETRRLAGEFVLHPEHGHVHFADYAAYRLRSITEEGEPGDVVAAGEKISFCLMDATPFDLSLEGAPTTRIFSECENQTQGISVGWADIYTSDLYDQWIDIEDVEPGEYFFETVLDPDDNLAESDETNNSIIHRIILGVPEYEPDRFDTESPISNRLGIGDITLDKLSIHRPGDVDTYRWTAASDGSAFFDLNLDVDQDIDFFVWTSQNGERVFLGPAIETENGLQISGDVVAGKNYFLVARSLEGNTVPDYSMVIDGPDVIPDELEPNDVFLSPTVLDGDNSLVSSLSIHESDRDYFAWTPSNDGVMYADVVFNNLEGELSLHVFDFLDNTVHEGVAERTNRKSIDAQVRGGETYLLSVSGVGEDQSTDYSLSVMLVDIPSDQHEPNDDNASPTNIGIGDVELSDLTIHQPFNRDFYAWSAESAGETRFELSFDSAEGDLDVVLWGKRRKHRSI